MNDFQDTVAVRMGRTSAQVHAFVSPENTSDTAAPATEKQEDDGRRQSAVVERIRPSLVAVPLIVGGLSGSVLALAAFLVLTELWPAQDPRVPAIANHMVSADQRADVQERALRAAEVDVVRLLEASTGMDQRIKQQDARTKSAAAEIDAARRELRDVVGTRSPIFGIAVAQLGATIAAGLPFETEWVNVYALTADDPTLRARIAPLMASARTGIHTVAQLRALLVRVARERGVPHGAQAGLIGRNMMRLQTIVGLPLGFTPAEVMTSTLVGAADQQLGSGDVAAALETLERLPEPYGDRLAPWMIAAQRHESARTTIDVLGGYARDRLREAAQSSARTQ